MSKSPAFQFYPNDWLSSPRIMLMTPAEEGAYIRLLCICWMKGHLPDDDNLLAQLSRLNKGWFDSSDKIRSCFTNRNGKLYNERLSKERGKQLKWRRKSREGGVKSGKSRKAKRLSGDNERKGGSQMVDTKHEPNANQRATLQSSSSSSFKHTQEECVNIGILLGIPEQQSKDFHTHYSGQGWLFGNGLPITDVRAGMVRWRNNQYRFNKTESKSGGKTILYPIKGKICSRSDCRMPAVYKDTTGAYDSYACSSHLPAKVKERYE